MRERVPRPGRGIARPAAGAVVAADLGEPLDAALDLLPVGAFGPEAGLQQDGRQPSAAAGQSKATTAEIDHLRRARRHIEIMHGMGLSIGKGENLVGVRSNGIA